MLGSSNAGIQANFNEEKFKLFDEKVFLKPWSQNP